MEHALTAISMVVISNTGKRVRYGANLFFRYAIDLPSFPRRRESRACRIPAFAGMTVDTSLRGNDGDAMRTNLPSTQVCASASTTGMFTVRRATQAEAAMVSSTMALRVARYISGSMVMCSG